MTEAATTQQDVLRMERRFDAAPEAVFDAWTNPEVLRRWWAAAPGWETPSAEVDLRAGGRYRLTMRDPEAGAEHTVGGLATAESGAWHEHGWNACFDNLAQRVFA